MGEPEADDRLGGPREMRLISRLSANYGYTEGCLGCAHKQAGLPDHQQHSAGCLRGIYERMKAVQNELHRMVRNEERLGQVPPSGRAHPKRSGADARSLRCPQHCP